jgi:hypothetical protein
MSGWFVSNSAGIASRPSPAVHDFETITIRHGNFVFTIPVE